MSKQSYIEWNNKILWVLSSASLKIWKRYGNRIILLGFTLKTWWFDMIPYDDHNTGHCDVTLVLIILNRKYLSYQT